MYIYILVHSTTTVRTYVLLPYINVHSTTLGSSHSPPPSCAQPDISRSSTQHEINDEQQITTPKSALTSRCTVVMLAETEGCQSRRCIKKSCAARYQHLVLSQRVFPSAQRVCVWGHVYFARSRLRHACGLPERDRKGREGKGREGKGREGKGKGKSRGTKAKGGASGVRGKEKEMRERSRKS